MIIQEKINLEQFGDFAKVVVDLEKQILAIGCEFHLDCADELVANGSNRLDLWGANIYPQDKKIDFVSFINIRPADDNHSMEIQIPEIKQKVEEVIHALLF